MTTEFETRYAIGPNEAKTFGTNQLRDAFLADNLFEADKLKLIVTHYDRVSRVMAGNNPIYI